MRKIENRQIAIEQGQKTYHGSECKNCNLTLRYVNGHGCLNCQKIRMRSENRKIYDAKYSLENSAKKVFTANKWKENNKEKRRIAVFNYDSKRRANKKSGDSFSKIRDWELSQLKVCYWCNIDCYDNYHIDHYHPLSKGGTHTIDNLVISCPKCNVKKNAKDPYEFAKNVGRLF